MMQNNKINMPSKKSQKRKKSTQTTNNGMSNSLVNNSNAFSNMGGGPGSNQVA